MLVRMKEVLNEAKNNKYGVGAFNVPNLESIMAVIQTAEEENIPVILQHAEVHEDLISIDIIGPIMLEMAKKATVPVCVHLDHGASFELCMQAIRLGFTSIMYDASDKSFEENLKETKEIVRIAHAAGVSVEAELGHVFTSAVGGGEGRGPIDLSYYESEADCYTDPEQAKYFIEHTGVDALAISFGTTHGVYLTEPTLDLSRISKIKEKIDIPFVMHGGSGVSDADFRIAIQNGISKINYFTYMSMAGGKAVTEFMEKQESKEHIFFHDISLAALAGMKENVRHAMRVFYHRSEGI